MTESEWNSCDDAGTMLDYLWQQYGVSPYFCDLRFGGDLRDHSPENALVGLAAISHRRPDS